MVKGTIKSKVAPVLAEFIEGFGKENLREFIAYGGSVWDNLVKREDKWKRQTLEGIKAHPSEFNELTTQAGLKFLMKTLTECDGLGWLPQVISPTYARSEVEKIKRDLGNG